MTWSARCPVGTRLTGTFPCARSGYLGRTHCEMVPPLLLKVAVASELFSSRSTIGAAATRGPEVDTIAAAPFADLGGTDVAGVLVEDCGGVTAGVLATPVESCPVVGRAGCLWRPHRDMMYWSPMRTAMIRRTAIMVRRSIDLRFAP